jgi:hypothetical protein
MLSHPSNRELLLHPDVAQHPLPSLTELAKDTHWPWGPNPASVPPVHMTYGAGAHPAATGTDEAAA